MDAIGIALVALAMVVGVIGTVLPFLPGLPIVWAAALFYGIVAGFGAVGWVSFAIITALAVLGIVAGIVLPHRHVKEGGAPMSTVLASIVGAIVGFFLIPVIGLPLGAVVGVLLAERVRTADWGTAWVATKNLIVGFGLGALAQLGCGLAMIVTWIAWVVID
ncbi:MAG: DUF456 domain-containing protein [Actinomycetota bacterium]